MNNFQSNEPLTSIFNQFLSFLFHPKPINTPQNFSLHSVGQVLILYLSILFVTLLLMSIVSLFIGLENFPHKLEDIFSLFPKWQLFLIVVIIAPAVEEFIFRFPLRYSIASAYLALVVIEIIIYFVLVHLFSISITISLVLLILPLTIFTFLFMRKSDINAYYPIFFYIICFGFAIAHLTNFETGSFPWKIGPLLVLPQILLGLLLGFLRLKYGMWANLLVHMVNNLLPMILILSDVNLD